MGRPLQIIGSGGGGKSGGGGGGISEDPDTLSSVAFARFVDLIGEGEVAGLVNGEYSIYLDGVPLRAVGGTPNFKPFKWAQRVGTQSQDVIPGFVGTQQENSVGLKVLKSSGLLIRSIPDADADSVRVTVAVQGLTTTDEEAKITGAEVAYKIYVRRDGSGTWTLGKSSTIKGKTGSRYQVAAEVPLAALGAGPYEVAVERVTDDGSSSLIVDDLYWDSYTVINYERLTYPNSALVGMEIDARYFNQVPERTYHVRGLKVRVPMNYDPVTRRYATTGPGTTLGAWDGTFKVAYTNNPAWCFYDLVTSTRYGLGNSISASQIDKFSIYLIGQYCDGSVPNGASLAALGRYRSAVMSVSAKVAASIPVPRVEYEPRFTLNCVINTREDAYKVLNNLASVFFGMPYWGDGGVTVTQDRPAGVSMAFTNANVEDGVFTYEGSSRAQRHTSVVVGWNDVSDNGKQKFEYVEDREGILRYGERRTEVIAFGTTSRSQARRFGLRYLYTQRLQTNAVSFNAGLDAMFLRPGDVCSIADSNRAGVRWGGRVVGSGTNSVTLDAPVTLTAGAYTLMVRSRTGGKLVRTVTIPSAGDYDVLPVAVDFTVFPRHEAVWTLESEDLALMQVRIVSVKHESLSKVAITAVEHNPSKYEAVERAVPAENPDYSFLSYKDVPAIAGLKLTENSFKTTVKSVTVTRLEASWDLVDDPMVRSYAVTVVFPDGRVRYYSSPDATFDVAAYAGTYTVRIAAINQFGIRGPLVSATKVVVGKDLLPPANVTGFTYSSDDALGVLLSWNDVDDFIDYYEIHLGSWAGPLVARTKANNFRVGPIATTARVYYIRARDTSGNYSAVSATLTVAPVVTNPPTVTYRIVGADEELSWSEPSSTFQIDHYEVRYGTSYAAGAFVVSTKARSYSRRVAYTGDRRYWVAAVDVAGNVGTAGSVFVDISDPGQITSARAEVVDNNALLFWQPPSTGSLPIDRYEVRKGANWAAGTAIGSNGNSTFTTTFEQQSGLFTYWVKAVDSAGNFGPEKSIVAQISQPPDYVLRVSVNSTFSGTLTNMVMEGGSVVGPVNTSEDWSTHFSTRGWSTPQDQIAAGYPIYLQPSITSGSYDETFDYGAILPATTVSATLDYTVITGSVSVSCQIYTKAAAGDAWIAAGAGLTNATFSNFRYVRVVFTATCTAGANLVRYNALNLKLANKLKTDSGTGTVTDATNGVVVPFNVAFIDADTPVVQPAGTTPLIPVVDFTDTPLPTSFRVYLYTTSGVKTTGSFSWTGRGY